MPSTDSLRTSSIPPVLCMLAAGFWVTLSYGQTPQAISFNRDVRPILSDRCFQCHGPDGETREADVRFDVEEIALEYIEKGDANNSHMLQLIVDGDMPPPEINKALDQEEIEILRKWIDEGAKWSEFWAYEPPVHYQAPPSPLPADAHWIDHFVASRLREHGLSLNSPADKRTLLRRLYFDLTGLPPTLKAVEAFVNDRSDDAYEKRVDELLASQHFGERMAMYWLDLVRYADTVGYHGDQPHNISPYRDWVIDAFNNNMPFDQFTQEQLAGDLLENPSTKQLVASGYNRLLQTSHEGGVQPKEYSAIYAADRVRNVSMVWMGATVGCAQCHDHKYDPYSTKDFYSLAAFFADIDDEAHFRNGTNSLPTRRDPELLLISDADRTELDNARSELDAAQKELRTQQKKSKELPADQDLLASIKKLELNVENLKRSVSEIEGRGRYTMVTKRLSKPRMVRVLNRGNWMDDSGEIVPPAVPAFLGDVTDKNRKGKDRANRLDLARWLTDQSRPSGMLTARVMANRWWYLMMGVGISPSLDDFGGQGVPPVFPELLDRLASEFGQDWNVKSLIRQIVLTKTYQQSSLVASELRERDPDNELFGRQSRHRLPAEMVRDNALAISGLLVADDVGGKSIKPYQPAKYYRHLNFPVRQYKHDQDRSQWRRGVYVHWQRQFLHPTLKALDAPSREECTASRPKSNTPLAALALLNDPSFVEAARAFGTRIVVESQGSDTGDRINWAVAQALSRPADQEEVNALMRLYESEQQYFTTHPEHTAEFLAVGLSQDHDATGLDQAELAAWTMVARAIFNSSEFVTRN